MPSKLVAPAWHNPSGEDSRHVKQLQAGVDDAVATVNRQPTFAADGKLLKAVTIAAGATVTLTHGLNRNIVGWQALRVRLSAAQLFEVSATRTQLTLTNSGAGSTIVDVWVY